jgi:hypothetical protein
MMEGAVLLLKKKLPLHKNLSSLTLVHTLLVGMQASATTLENNMEAS